MQVSLVGHACLVVEGGNARVLTDPLLFNPGERTLDPCPKRIVHAEAIGALDAIVLSHRHLDHFDVESLRRLDRRVPLYVPRDPELAAKARSIGFANVIELAPWESAAIGDMQLFVTPSHRDDVAEQGMVFRDATAAFWNQVDTVIRQADCLEVLKRTELDLCICAYNPLLEHATMWVDEVDFPTSRYERLLEMAICSEARLVVPGSFGLRMVGAHAPFNQRCYPVSRERFVADLQRIAPERQARVLNPGETVTLARGVAPVFSASPYATLVEDDTRLVRFAPNEMPAPELVDENPTRFADRELDRGLEQIVVRIWPTKVGQALTAAGPMLTLKSRRATIDFDIVFPLKRRRWRLVQWTPQAKVVEVMDDSRADYTFTYVASQVYAMAMGKPYREPQVYASRSRVKRADGLNPIDPARLAGVDAYETTDENFDWSPLGILAGLTL
jgi:UDP-MurNAc hydroxylase